MGSNGVVVPACGIQLQAISALVRDIHIERYGEEPLPKPYSHEAQVMGKPNPGYLDKLISWDDLDKSRSVFVGDRLDTDILMGNEADVATIFVATTGAHNTTHLHNPKYSHIVPTHVLD